MWAASNAADAYATSERKVNTGRSCSRPRVTWRGARAALSAMLTDASTKTKRGGLPKRGGVGGPGSEHQTRADSSRPAPCSIAQCPRLLPAPPARSPARRGGAARGPAGGRWAAREEPRPLLGVGPQAHGARALPGSLGRAPGLAPARSPPRAARIPTATPRAQAWLGTLGRSGQRTDWRVT